LAAVVTGVVRVKIDETCSEIKEDGGKSSVTLTAAGNVAWALELSHFAKFRSSSTFTVLQQLVVS
jgi:hypothetical protein